MTQPVSNKHSERDPILWLLILGFFTALLFPVIAIACFMQGAAGILLAVLAAFMLMLIATLARRFMPKPLKNVVFAGAVLGAVAGVILVRWQSVELHNRANILAFYVLPIAAAGGQVLGTSKWSNKVAEFLSPLGFKIAGSPSLPEAQETTGLWVAKSLTGDLAVFDQSVQSGGTSPFVYYYDLSAHRLNRIQRKDIGKEFDAVTLIEIRLGGIREYEKWRNSVGDEHIRKMIADAEKSDPKWADEKRIRFAWFG